MFPGGRRAKFSLAGAPDGAAVLVVWPLVLVVFSSAHAEKSASFDEPLMRRWVPDQIESLPTIFTA